MGRRADCQIGVVLGLGRDYIEVIGYRETRGSQASLGEGTAMQRDAKGGNGGEKGVEEKPHPHITIHLRVC